MFLMMDIGNFMRHIKFSRTITYWWYHFLLHLIEPCVVLKEKKEFKMDLKAENDSPNPKTAADALNVVECKWGKIYCLIIAQQIEP